MESKGLADETMPVVSNGSSNGHGNSEHGGLGTAKRARRPTSRMCLPSSRKRKIVEQPPAEQKVKIEEQAGDLAAQPVKSKKTPTKAKQVDANEFDAAWICTECKEAECMIQPSAYDFLICDGKCNRLFHYPCAGLTELPASDEDWLCKDCTNQQHQCSLCQEYGKDDEDVFLCRKDKCGLFFHESCLSMHNVEVTMIKHEKPKIKAETISETASPIEQEPDDGELDLAEIIYAPVFTCPAHCCWTCTQEIPREEEKEDGATESRSKKKRGKKKKTKSPLEVAFMSKTEIRLFRCLECPRAYHLTCIPPNSLFHELGILCHEHSQTHMLPDLDISNSIQNAIEDKMDRKILKLQPKKRKHGASSFNPFFPGIRGDRLIEDETLLLEYLREKSEDGEENEVQFCLPCDLKDEVHAKPPTYKHIHSLRYDPENRPKKLAPNGESCQCVGRCMDDCMNRMLMMECHDEGKNSNCAVGGNDCGNRSLGKRQYAKCKPKREQGKGWGLVAMESVKKGELVQEYMGEVIDEAIKEFRLEEWTKEHPNDPNFYIMALPAGWYIDARHEANLSRFINHSCGPNCKLLTVNVKGYMRVGIYATRDISAGEVLNYDYHFDTKHGDKFVCRCGAKNCRGTMKGGRGQSDDKKQLNLKEAKARLELEKKFLDEVSSKQVVSQVDALVPVAEQPTETVSAGPQGRHRDTAVRNRIFLWRNASRGADFTSRLAAINARKQHAKGEAVAQEANTSPVKDEGMN